MRTELTKTEIEELEEVGINNVKTLYDILEVLPEQLNSRYHLHINHQGDSSWRVAYYSTNGECFMHVCMGYFITALQRMLVALAKHVNLLKTSLSKCTEQ